MDNGFAVVKRMWKNGDIVELELPMPVRRTSCDPRVKENVGTTAVTRGPLVYCAEGTDNGVVQQLNLFRMRHAHNLSRKVLSKT